MNVTFVGAAVLLLFTGYARTNREEDFCETLEFFLTKRSRFKPSCPDIKDKLAFVRELGRRLGNN